jgi:hypothetical protein
MATTSSMLQPVSWGVLAAIHLLPALALFRPALIRTLYGVDRANPLFLLLHHRAALFLVVMVIAIWAAFDPGSRRLASVTVGLSMVSFLILYWQAGLPTGLRSIAIADLVGLPFLAFVVWKAWA